jgi:hypothetical protein
MARRRLDRVGYPLGVIAWSRIEAGSLGGPIERRARVRRRRIGRRAVDGALVGGHVSGAALQARFDGGLCCGIGAPDGRAIPGATSAIVCDCEPLTRAALKAEQRACSGHH